MATDSFFDERTEQSEIKAMIVSKYFPVWANVIIGAQKNRYGKGKRLAYIDLFAGPGQYEDGNKSTPLLVLERAIEDDNIREHLVTLFNDEKRDFVLSLQESIASLPGIETLVYKPRIENKEIGEQTIKRFEQMNPIPKLSFLDPWGYKGLSLRLFHALVLQRRIDIA